MSIVIENPTQNSARSTLLNPDVKFSGAASLIFLPTSFLSRWTPTFNIYESGTSYFTDFDITALKPTGTEMFVAKTGNDTTGNGTIGNPYRTITKAYNMGATVINIRAGIYDRGDLPASFNPTRSIALISYDGPGTAIISRIQAGTLSWTQQASPNSDVYLTTGGGTSVRTILDTNYVYSGEYLKDGVTGVPTPYTSVASIAACQALPGSYYLTGSNLYVHTYNNTAPGSNIKSLRVETNWAVTTTNITVYLDGIEMWGDEPFRYIVTTSPTSSIAAARNCGFRYGGLNSSNAFRVNGINYSYAISCECSDYLGDGDGFNYHADAGSTVKTNGLEVNCTAKRIGLTTSSTNNGSTAHDSCNVIRLNGNYSYTRGPVIADVLSAYSLNLGVTAGNSQAVLSNAQKSCFQIGESGSTGATMWLKNCTTNGANNWSFAQVGTTTMYDMGGNTNSTTGTPSGTYTGSVITPYP